MVTRGVMKETHETQEATTVTGGITIKDVAVSAAIFREVTTVMTGDDPTLRRGTRDRKLVRRESVGSQMPKVPRTGLACILQRTKLINQTTKMLLTVRI